MPLLRLPMSQLGHSRISANCRSTSGLFRTSDMRDYLSPGHHVDGYLAGLLGALGGHADRGAVDALAGLGGHARSWG
jgi:hypothetical protein